MVSGCRGNKKNEKGRYPYREYRESRKRDKVGRYSDNKGKVVYLPTAARAKALRLFDELAMNPPVKLSEWAAVCVANDLSHNESTFSATLARDLMMMSKVVIESGLVFDADARVK